MNERKELLTEKEKELIQNVFSDWLTTHEEVLEGKVPGQTEKEAKEFGEKVWYPTIGAMLKVCKELGIEYPKEEEYGHRRFVEEVKPVVKEAVKGKKYIAEVPEEKIPEGVEVAKYVFVSETDADVVETMFEAMGAGKAEFRSAVNLGMMVRCVMYEKDEKWGLPIRVAVMDKDMAWHLQQLIDWVYRKQAKVLAVKKDKKEVSVAFRMEGTKPTPQKEKMFYHFKKTNGWELVGEPK